MKTRNDEAARLEKDYLKRLDNALADSDPAEAEDIKQGVKDHIEEAASECEGDEVTLVQMAGILEKLGPPEEYTSGESSQHPSSQPAPAASVPVPPSAEPEKQVDFEFLHELLGSLWMALFVGIIGLFIPLVDLQITAIISGFMLLAVLKHQPEKQPASFRSAYIFALLVLIGMFGLFAVSSLTLLNRGFAILGIFILPLPVLDVIVYWKLMNGLIAICRKLSRQDIIDSISTRRILYILWTGILFCIFFAMSLTGLKALQINLLSFLTLPIQWLFGWFLVLRPVTMTREAIEGEEGDF